MLLIKHQAIFAALSFYLFSCTADSIESHRSAASQGQVQSSTTQVSSVNSIASPKWQTVTPGTEAVVEVCVQNNENRDVLIAEGRGPIHLRKITATVNGNRLDFADSFITEMPDEAMLHGLNPGQNEKVSFELSKLFNMSSVGTYKFSFSTAVCGYTDGHIVPMPDSETSASVLVKMK